MSIAVIILVIAFIIILLGLILSGTGASAGFGNISGQDLEIFKKTKDRGLTKIFQFIMFILMVVITVLIIVFAVLGI